MNPRSAVLHQSGYPYFCQAISMDTHSHGLTEVWVGAEPQIWDQCPHRCPRLLLPSRYPYRRCGLSCSCHNLAGLTPSTLGDDCAIPTLMGSALGEWLVAPGLGSLWTAPLHSCAVCLSMQRCYRASADFATEFARVLICRDLAGSALGFAGPEQTTLLC